MKILKQNSNSHKGVELWAKSINDFGNFGRHFQCATSAKILAAMYARVPQAMAQFVLKIEKLSHIMGPTPILEMARAYGLRPRLWLLVTDSFIQRVFASEVLAAVPKSPESNALTWSRPYGYVSIKTIKRRQLLLIFKFVKC